MHQSALLRSQRFLPLFITQFMGAFNDNFFKNALVILITYGATTVFGIPSAQMVAAASGIFILPYFLFSAQSGQMADRFDKAMLTRWVKIAEIGIMGIASIGFLFHHFELLFVSLFLMGTHSTVFGPIKYGILPQHLTDQEIIGGNALIEAGTFLAILLGTIAGGVLITIPPFSFLGLNLSGAFLVSVGLVLCAIVGYLASRSIPTAEPPDPDLKISLNPIPPTIQMIRYTTETPSVFRSILGISWFWLFGATLLNLFPTYCKDQIHASEHLVTVFLALFSIGIGIGSLLCEKLSRHHLELGLVPFGSIGITLFCFDLFWIGVPAEFAAATVPVTISQFFSNGAAIRIVIDLFLLSAFSGFFIVPLYALIQMRSHPQHRSRIIAGNNILNAIFMVAGSLLLILLLHWNLTVPQIFLVMAVLNLIVAIYIYYLIPEFLLRFLVWGLANVVYRMRVTGAENIPKDGPAVVVANHVSYVDWMILAAAIARPVRFIMHHSFARGPMKLLVKRAKIILIASAKEDPELMEKALEKAIAELKEGEMVCIFPEGTLTRDGNMNPFRPGVLKILESAPVPVIPVAIQNMWGSYFSRSEGKALLKRPRRFWSRIAVVIGKPIPPAQVTLNGLEAKVKELLG